MTTKQVLAAFCDKFRAASRRAIFCGAGISRPEPASIPLFSEMMGAYLDALELPGRRVLRLHAGQEAEAIREKICNLPVDGFFADIVFALGKETLAPLDWLQQRAPNQAHALIARLVNTHGITTLLTPNFDCLLERALPEFKTVSLMKRRSRDSKDEVVGYPHISLIGYQSECISPAVNAVFHLHGTDLLTRLEITPGATSIPFDHFDHANLAVRLGGATLLVVGSSGAWDDDLLDLLKRCDIAQVLWVKHSSQEDVVPAELPQSWRLFFQDKATAIAGNTTQILAVLDGQELSPQDSDGGVAEFRDHVVDQFKTYDPKRKLHLWAELANKVERGDVAESILLDVKKKPISLEPAEEDSSEKEHIFLNAIGHADSLTMRDGREITPAQFIAEYNHKKKVYEQVRHSFWPLLIGRTMAIAMSRRPDKKYSYQDVIEYFTGNVVAKLEAILPYDSMGQKEVNEFKWLSREWMLAKESLGIFYHENKCDRKALECLDAAVKICAGEEDRHRIIMTKIICGCRLSLYDLLKIDEAREIETVLKDKAEEIDPAKAKHLRDIADKCFFSGGINLALTLYQSITDRWPSNVYACLNYSNMLRATGRYAEAASELDRGLEKFPRDSRLLCNKGYALNELGRQRDAIPILEAALDVCPTDKYAWNNLGNSFYETMRLRKALECFQQALRCDPHFSTANVNKENTMRRLAGQV